MKYVAYREDGVFNGFYSDDIHGENIPKLNLKINDELWQELLKDNYNVKINGIEVYNNEVLYIDDLEKYFIKIEKPLNEGSPSELSILKLRIEQLENLLLIQGGLI